ncbi:protein kinase domain-containing protein [Hyalangium gracile]|uniref:protein kinase domain-containing protein n=1 Tax=Hyalangium gracile TaxID=394092 RepID=UPI001CCA99D0|nr:protein kinase [Hyalangium gracile]
MSDSSRDSPPSPEGAAPEPSASAETPPTVDLAGTLISGGDARARPKPPPLPDAQHLPVVDKQTYVVEGVFARGGIGRILRARDVRLGRPVALKELLDPQGPDEGRFLNEALVTARLQHPGIVPIYEAGRWSNGEPFYAMKLVSGRSLDERLSETKSFGERLSLLPHVLAVAEAVAYAHSQRIIHRDLKPANVLVGEFGETVVIDWGLAKQLTEPDAAPSPSEAPTLEFDADSATPSFSKGQPNHTLAGIVLGTPAYMPPEQAAGRPVDERADVYALGAILYHLLVGTRPYGVGSASEVLDRVIAGPPPPLERLQQGIPEELLAIVTQAMARDPARRYPTARALAEDLRRFLMGQLVGAHHYSRLDLVRRFIRRNRAVVAVAGIALAALGTMGALSVRRIMAERDRAEHKQAEAEAASHQATVRADQLTLVEARSAVERFPNKALEWLGTLSPAFTQWGTARVIAADAQARGLALLLRGHTQGVNFVTFSPEGQWVATVSDDRTVRLWGAHSGEMRLLGSHEDEVWRAAFSPDGRWLATTGKDRTLRLWSVESAGSQVLRGHVAPILGVVFSPNGRHVFTSSVDGEVWRWDLPEGKGQRLGKHEGWVASLDSSRDSRQLVTVGKDDKTLRLWDVETGQSRSLGTHPAAPYQVTFSPDGKLIATGCVDGKVRLWEAATGKVRVLEGHTNRVQSVAFSPDGTKLASRSHDGTVRLWDLATGTARVFEGSKEPPAPLAFSSDGRWVATGGRDRLAWLWDVNTGQGRVLRGAEDAVTSLAFSPDGQRLAVASVDGVTRVFPVEAHSSQIVGQYAGPVLSLRFSADGHTLVSSGADGRVRRWSPSGGQAVEMGGHRGAVPLVRSSADGERVVTGGDDGTVRLWDRTGRELQALPVSAHSIRALEYSADGKWVAIGSADGFVRLWEPLTGSERKLGQHLKGGVLSLAFSPDGRFVASGGEDNALRLWELRNGQGRALHTSDDVVVALAFSPDGRWLVSGSKDHTLWLQELPAGKGRRIDVGGIGVLAVGFSPDSQRLISSSQGDNSPRLWDVWTGEARGVLRGHLDQVNHFAWSPEGGRLVTASDDRTVRVWDVESGESRVLQGHTGGVVQVAFSPDGRRVASASKDGTVRLWPDDLPLEPAALQRWLRETLRAEAGGSAAARPARWLPAPPGTAHPAAGGLR